jgi:pectin methylesterase-like acyl-CoA thioesterase
MTRKLFTSLWPIILMLVAMLAAASADMMRPLLYGISSIVSGNVAGAAQLSVNPLAPLTPTGIGFTYQGSLRNGGNPANGQYDFAFTLYDDAITSTLVTTPITITNQTVSGGLFTVSLDFGTTAFDGNARYLQVAARQSGVGPYITLSPRQVLSPAPYALFAFKTAPYKNVVVVAQTGGQYTSIQAALNSIADSSPTNRYLVWVAPGTYTETVTMKAYVDIEGSGEDITKITFTGSPNPDTGTVVGASNAELRSLTVENTGGNTNAVAIYNLGASPSLLDISANSSGGTTTNLAVYNLSISSPNMRNVTATASGAPGYNYGVLNSASSSPSMINVKATASGASSAQDFGVANLASSAPSMNNVTATASGGTAYGVYNDTSSPKITGSNLSATGGTGNFGVFTFGGGAVTVAIDNSKVTGGTNALYNGAGSTTRVGASQLVGGAALNNSGTLTCSASYDGNNKRLGTQCTRNTKVAIIGLTDGDYTSITAALNDTATWCGTPSATNKCLVRVQPGTYSERVTMSPYVDIEGAGEDVTKITFTGSNPDNTGTIVGANNAELRFLSVENTGGNSYAVGIYNPAASPSLLHIVVTASGAGTTNYGVYNNHSSPNMTNVTATASGGATYNIGVYNYESSSPSMTNVTATASGGASSTNYAVINHNSSPRLVTSILSASGGSANYGVDSRVSSTVTIDASKITVPITGTTILQSASVTTRVGASQLSGGPASNGGGTLSCAGVYDENYTFFPSSCP